MRYALTLLLLLVPHVSDAQVVKIVRQVCGPFRCTFETGSGVVVGRTPSPAGGDTYRILTVYHVCGNRWDLQVKQWVRRGQDYKMTAVTPAGRFPAQIAAWNGEAMLMLLTIEVPAGAPAIASWPIADTLPSAGDAVTIHGYSHTRNCQYGARSLVLRTYGPKEFETTAPFEQGESGGPIVKDGKIVGLCEGYDARTKFGLGPSVVAIRWFLDLPAIGARPASQQPAELPLRSDVSVPGGSVPVLRESVPEPGTPASGTTPPTTGQSSGQTPTPAPAGDLPGSQPNSGSDAPLFTPPEHIAQRAPVAESDPISNPRPPKTSVVAKVARTAAVGLDIWSMLAGAGIVAGTGGVGAVGLLAWRGFKAGRAVAGVIRSRRTAQSNRSTVTQTPVTGATVASVIPPSVPLAPQNVNFVEIPTDYRRESVDYALAETGRRYPGAIATVEVVKSLINQHLAGTGHGQATLHQ